MKLMFQSADGNMQELDDQQLQELKGKRIVFQDGAGNLQQLSAAAPSPRGSSSAATFLTSPLAVVVLAGLALLGAVLAAQRGLRRRSTLACDDNGPSFLGGAEADLAYEPVGEASEDEVAQFLV